jgi:hypothetical protein
LKTNIISINSVKQRDGVEENRYSRNRNSKVAECCQMPASVSEEIFPQWTGVSKERE